MKRLFAVMLCVVMLAMFAGCAAQDSQAKMAEGAETPAAKEAQTKAEETGTVTGYMSIETKDGEYFAEIEEAVAITPEDTALMEEYGFAKDDIVDVVYVVKKDSTPAKYPVAQDAKITVQLSEDKQNVMSRECTLEEFAAYVNDYSDKKALADVSLKDGEAVAIEEIYMP